MSDSFAMSAVNLAGDGLGAFIGEVWDIAIDDQGDFLLAGVNQDIDIGTIWFNTSPNPSSIEDWNLVNIDALLSIDENNATRFYGACRDGDRLLAVGDYSQRSIGMAMLSTDGGASWIEATADQDLPPLSKCQFINGTAYIVGASGLFAVLDPSKL